MVNTVKGWLLNCPYMGNLSVGTLQPQGDTGLFPKGISRVRRDILGDARVSTAFILRHRDYPDADWVDKVSAWILSNKPADMQVTPKGGKLVNPTKDGWGTWELELIVES